MRIAEVRVRQVAIPRIYDTYCADPKNLKNTIDHGRSTYQIIELKTRGGPAGTGEVSDIAPRMNAPSAEALQTMLSGVLLDGDVRAWRTLCDRVEKALPGDWYPELRQLILFGVEIALLDLIGKIHGLPVYELLGGRCRRAVSVSWVAFLRGDASLTDELQALEREVTDQTVAGMKAFKLKVGEDHERDLERVRLTRRIAGSAAYIKVDASGSWEEDEALLQAEGHGRSRRRRVRDADQCPLATHVPGRSGPDRSGCRWNCRGAPKSSGRFPHTDHRARRRSGRCFPGGCDPAPGRGYRQCRALSGRRTPPRPAADPRRRNRGDARPVGKHHRTGTWYGGVGASRRGVGKRPHTLGPGRPWTAPGGRMHNAFFPLWG